METVSRRKFFANFLRLCPVSLWYRGRARPESAVYDMLSDERMVRISAFCSY